MLEVFSHIIHWDIFEFGMLEVESLFIDLPKDWPAQCSGERDSTIPRRAYDGRRASAVKVGLGQRSCRLLFQF